MDDKLLDDIMESSLVMELELDRLREEAKRAEKTFLNMQMQIHKRDKVIEALKLDRDRYKGEVSELVGMVGE
jgi:hypothetical protein